jgi:hypothetical protein
VRPRHRFQTSLRDRLLTDLTHPVGTLVDPSQRLFDRPRQTAICLVQVDLKLGFLVGIGLFDEIAI